MRSEAANPASATLVPAAQYLRMSTEHQQYSIANQSATIALYAAAHGIGIVRSFSDEGKSGTTIKGRRALQDLLAVVKSGNADFNLVLVYDVSRWGRFPDADEAAHYEFLCKNAGIGVQYCAEQFTNDNSTASTLLKALKRAMAGEYSRELSVRTMEGRRRVAVMGYWGGGCAPFGLQRQIVSHDGRSKECLSTGQWKSIKTDRVVLRPGAPEEIETVQRAFELYVDDKKTRREIAEILNLRYCLWGATPWDQTKVLKLLRNPVYKGAYAFSKNRLRKDLPRKQWLIHEHAFSAIIPEAQWNEANERLMRETTRPVDSEMLRGLRRLWKREGKINSDLINAARDVPSAPAYAQHFGSLNEAYKLIGYPIKHGLGYIHEINLTRRLRENVFDQICSQIQAIGGTAERVSSPERIVINGNIRAKVKLTTGHLYRLCFGQTRWILFLEKEPSTDIQIFARLEPPNREILDYFVIPAISQLRSVFRPKRENHPPFLDLYHFTTLETLVQAFARVSITEAS